MSQFAQYFAAFPLFMMPTTSKCAKSICISPPVISFQFLILEYHFKGLCWHLSEILWKFLWKKICLHGCLFTLFVEVLFHSPTILCTCNIRVSWATKKTLFCLFPTSTNLVKFIKGKFTCIPCTMPSYRKFTWLNMMKKLKPKTDSVIFERKLLKLIYSSKQAISSFKWHIESSIT